MVLITSDAIKIDARKIQHPQYHGMAVNRFFRPRHVQKGGDSWVNDDANSEDSWPLDLRLSLTPSISDHIHLGFLPQNVLLVPPDNTNNTTKRRLPNSEIHLKP